MNRPSLKTYLDNPREQKKFVIKKDHTHKENLNFIFLKTSIPPIKPHDLHTDSLCNKDHASAKDYISYIEDPLWKDICLDLLHMMGPYSALKICRSKLGEFSLHDKSFDIICENEEIARFITRYDFVVLGSLRRYFPALEKLKIQVYNA